MPKWKELKRYCENDGWEMYKKTDHWFYRKFLPDGSMLRTKVSMGSGEVPPNLWKMILKKQLQTTQENFNDTI